MKQEIGSRRAFIKKYSLAATSLLGISILFACNDNNDSSETKVAINPKSCRDLTGVSEEEINKRKKLGYVDETPIADNFCGNCKLFLPVQEGQTCGGCQLFKGPVEEKGYCGYYAPQDNAGGMKGSKTSRFC